MSIVEQNPLTSITSPFPVLAMTLANSELLEKCGISQAMQDKMNEVGFTKAACVWGVVLVGTTKFPDSNLQYAANVAANMMDPDETGQPKNEDIRKAFSAAQNGWFLGGGVSEDDEGTPCAAFDAIQGMDCYSLQNWKSDESFEQDPLETYHGEVKSLSNEEVFHLYTHSLAKVFPAQLGDTDFTTSIMCRESARLTCLSPGWWHEENTCPNGNPDASGTAPAVPLQGGCAVANCDCVEFFHQAVLKYRGMEPGWISDNMPSTQEAMAAMLSEEFKTMIDDPQYGVPQAAFTGTYGVATPKTLAEVLAPAETPADNSGDTPADNSGDTPADNSGDTPADNSGDNQADNSGDAQADNSGDAQADNSGDKADDGAADGADENKDADDAAGGDAADKDDAADGAEADKDADDAADGAEADKDGDDAAEATCDPACGQGEVCAEQYQVSDADGTKLPENHPNYDVTTKVCVAEAKCGTTYANPDSNGDYLSAECPGDKADEEADADAEADKDADEAGADKEEGEAEGDKDAGEAEADKDADEAEGDKDADEEEPIQDQDKEEGAEEEGAEEEGLNCDAEDLSEEQQAECASIALADTGNAAEAGESGGNCDEVVCENEFECCGDAVNELGGTLERICGNGEESFEVPMTIGQIEYSHTCGAMKLIGSLVSVVAALSHL